MTPYVRLMSSYNSDPTIRANTSKRGGFSNAVHHVKVKMASSTVPVKSDAMQTKLVFYVNGRKVFQCLLLLLAASVCLNNGFSKSITV